MIINMSNITQVYDKDPNEYNDDKPIDKITWKDFEEIVGVDWTPGSNLPFDPIATKLAKELNLTVYVIGKDLVNLDNLLNKKDFLGTVISGK